MAVIVLEIGAENVFQDGKSFLFHLPAGTAARIIWSHPFVLEGEIGYPGPGPAPAIGTDRSVMEEGDPKGDGGLVQGNSTAPP